MQKKTRLDVAVFEGGYAPSREKAKAIIMAGQVYVNNQKVDKAGFELKEGDKLEVRGKTLKYVSRGGLKLEKAMQVFPITLADKTCMDVVGLRIVCCKTAQSGCIPLMWAMASWPGACARTIGW